MVLQLDPASGPVNSGASRNRLGYQETEDPSRINDLGSCMEPVGTPWEVPCRCHMFSIITWPKPEHDTCVAPSISRA